MEEKFSSLPAVTITNFTFSFAGRTRTKDKYRVVYSDHQRLELEKEFHYSRYITIRRKAELSQALSLSERQVSLHQIRNNCQQKSITMHLNIGKDMVSKPKS